MEIITEGCKLKYQKKKKQPKKDQLNPYRTALENANNTTTPNLEKRLKAQNQKNSESCISSVKTFKNVENICRTWGNMF